jgi:hypothetical protein
VGHTRFFKSLLGDLELNTVTLEQLPDAIQTAILDPSDLLQVVLGILQTRHPLFHLLLQGGQRWGRHALLVPTARAYFQQPF